MNWHSVFIWLKSIPDVIWSGLIASVLTLSGVLISNLSNTRRLRDQQQHESKEKSKERLTSARRDVYLVAASEFSAAMGHLGTIPQLDPRKDNLTAPLQAFNATAARVQLIADSSTANLASHTGQRLAELYFRLIAKAQPMFDLQIDAEMHADLYDAAQAELDRLLKQQRTLVESPGFDQSVFEALNRSLAFYQQQSLDHLTARSNALEQRFELQKAYMSELLPETMPLVEAQIPLAAALRRELELPTDQSELKARSKAGIQFMQSLLEKFIGSMK